MLPPDIHPDSRNRLPPLERAALSDEGQRLYDEIAADARAFLGFRGPGALRLRAPGLARLERPLSHYLRFDAGLDPALAETLILAVARENDQDFEWNNHERLARKAGVSETVIDAIRYRRPVDALDPRAAVLIRLAREAITAHEVGAETFQTALAQFGEEQLVLFVGLMGHYSATAYVLHVFAHHLPEGEASTLPRL
jgi:4-carboxymuconolactone decarboxylase